MNTSISSLDDRNPLLALIPEVVALLLVASGAALPVDGWATPRPDPDRVQGVPTLEVKDDVEDKDVPTLYGEAREAEKKCLAGGTDEQACNLAEMLYLRVLAMGRSKVERSAALEALTRISLWKQNRKRVAQAWKDRQKGPIVIVKKTPPVSSTIAAVPEGSTWAKRHLPWIGWSLVAGGVLAGGGVGGLYHGLGANARRTEVVNGLTGSDSAKGGIAMSHEKAFRLRDEADAQEQRAWVWGGIGGAVAVLGLGLLIVEESLPTPAGRSSVLEPTVEIYMNGTGVAVRVPGWGEVGLSFLPPFVLE